MLELLSTVWGRVGTAAFLSLVVGLIFHSLGSGFFSEAGKRLFNRWFPTKVIEPLVAVTQSAVHIEQAAVPILYEVKYPDDVEVDQDFQPPINDGFEYAWVRKLKIPQKEEEGWTYYPYGLERARCYRVIDYKRQLTREYVLRQRNAAA